MDFETAKRTLEALLFAADEPLSTRRLVSLLSGHFEDDQTAKTTIELALECLQEDYAKHSVELVKVASGHRFQVRDQYNDWIFQLWNRRQPRYSRALMETLAMIAYRQPVTRGEIEAVRGVGVSTNIIRTLAERGWIREVGKKPVPGQPALYGTTQAFLDYFSLKSLGDLPPMSEIESIVTQEKIEQETEQAPKDAQPSSLESQITEIQDPPIKRIDDT